MKVKELIEKLNEFDEDTEICFWIPNVRSGKWQDVELELNDIEFCNWGLFSENWGEYPTYEKNEFVYIGFKDICDKA